MKNWILCMLACLSFVAPIQAEPLTPRDFFAEIETADEKDKLYVESSDIAIIKNKIYLCCDSLLLPVTLVGVDSQGLYIEGFLEAVKSLTKCPICQQYYDSDNQPSTCPHYAPHPPIPSYGSRK